MKKIISLLISIHFCFFAFSQEHNTGVITGDFNINLQSYQEDSKIGAQAQDEIVLNNAYLNLNYTRGNFATGLRYESYLNALADFDPEFKGNGIMYRYATYSIDNLEITAGNYYEQLGSGLIFRSYEEKGLGIDVNKHVIPQICALNTSVLTLFTFKSFVFAMNASVLV